MKYTETDLMNFANYFKNWQGPRKVEEALIKWNEGARINNGKNFRH